MNFWGETRTQNEPNRHVVPDQRKGFDNRSSRFEPKILLISFSMGGCPPFRRSAQLCWCKIAHPSIWERKLNLLSEILSFFEKIQHPPFMISAFATKLPLHKPSFWFVIFVWCRRSRDLRHRSISLHWLFVDISRFSILTSPGIEINTLSRSWLITHRGHF